MHATLYTFSDQPLQSVRRTEECSGQGTGMQAGFFGSNLPQTLASYLIIQFSVPLSSVHSQC